MIKLTKRGLYIGGQINKEWIVKTPTVPHRLHRSGTVSLTITDKMTLAERRGILYIDMTKRAYVFIPKELLAAPEGKTFMSMKNSLYVYDIKWSIAEHNLQLTPIPTEEAKAQKSDVAKGVLVKFGL